MECLRCGCAQFVCAPQKKEAEEARRNCETLNNILLAEFDFFSNNLVDDFEAMMQRFLRRQADFHKKVCTCTCTVYTYVHVHVQVYVHVCMYVCVYVVHVRMYVIVHMCVCTYVCIYVCM